MNKLVTIPAGTSAGTYYIWVVADNGSVLTQPNYNNDYARSSALTVTVTPQQPDVLPQNITLGSSTVAPGGTLTVTFDIRNQGGGNAAATTTRLRLNQSTSTTSPADTSLGDVSTPAISANSVASGLNKLVTIPAGTPAGTYYIWVVADNGSVLTQPDYNNDYAHSSALTVTVTPGQPNLVPQNVTLNSYTVQAGNQVTISWTIANTGGGNCAASVTGLRLGQSPTSHPTSDFSFNSSFPTPAINAGQAIQQSTTVTIPANTAAGTFYVWVIADNVVNSTLNQTSTADDYAHSPALTVGSGPSLQGEPSSLGVIWFPSPNFNNRPANQVIDTVVIHTSQGSYASAKSVLTNPDPRLDEPPVGVDKRVSAHYVISETGEISQLVELDKRAWHATYYNDRSIGIEMAGYAEQQNTWNPQNLAALERLVAYLVTKYNIQIIHPSGDASTYPSCLFTEAGLVAHSQIQPGCNGYALKSDPGQFFPWTTFVQDVQALINAPRFTTVGGSGSQPTSGQFQIQVTTPSQQTVTVQASDDLLNWADVGVVNTADGKSVFTDTDAGSHSKRFYRPKP